MPVGNEISPGVEVDQVGCVVFEAVQIGEVIKGEGEALEAGEKGHVGEGVEFVGGEVEVAGGGDGVVWCGVKRVGGGSGDQRRVRGWGSDVV